MNVANRAWWLASLVIPGWSQLMLGRWTGFAWLALASVVWACFWLSALSSRLSAAALCAACAGLLHAACTASAARAGVSRTRPAKPAA